MSKFILTRYNYADNGIFGKLETDGGVHLMYTLEHAYTDGKSYDPKVPKGTYTCVRGMHRLQHMAHDFETFEIMNVPGHTDILFHTGNVNIDSAGCILVGMDCNQITGMLLQSRDAFNKLMDITAGLNNFELTIY